MMDDKITIPPAAIEFIESCVGPAGVGSPFHFETIEAFFDWLSCQTDNLKREVLTRLLHEGSKRTRLSRVFGQSVY